MDRQPVLLIGHFLTEYRYEGVWMFRKQENREKIEILAPAGSYESFRAAIAAGADAVYAGGSRFGARAFAENFSEEQLLEAIDYAHLHGRKFYLTVNTLLKNVEIQELYHYLEPLYLGGLDAVIVQDVGVLEYVRVFFPDLDIHASTQMTITGASGAEFLKEMGAVRVVPARELSLKEIRHMKERTGMEIECFVHGALCYCYSGQCLLSSLIGGRSGNRGQCAQPCRLPYTAEGEKGYLLSPKDICTLELIPELVEAGIDSFKIEGRMKRPEYVAGVTLMYRKYTDLYLQNGKQGYSVAPEDKEMLMDLYNRGGFHTGYYQQKNGRSMIAVERPNHAGVAAVKVISQRGRELKVKTLTEIHKGDILEFSGEKENYTFGTGCKKGGEMTILAPKGKKVAVGCVLNRIRNQQLLDELGDTGHFGKNQENIYGFLKLSAGKPATLTVCCGEVSVEVSSEALVEKASKSPLDEERVRQQIQKTGNTEFIFEHLEVLLEGEVFLPMQQLKEMRRRALEELTQKICESYHRSNQTGQQEDCPATAEIVPNTKASSTYLAVLVETEEQLQVVSDFPQVRRIYVESDISGNLFHNDTLPDTFRRIRQNGKEVFLAMPRVFREYTEKLFETRQVLFTLGCLSGEAQSERMDEAVFDGVLVRNFEEFQFLRRHGFDKKLILDHNLYMFNSYAKRFWKKLDIFEHTVPVELNRQEIAGLGTEQAELIIYGYLPVMTSAQCVVNTLGGCKKEERCISLKDRYQNRFFVKNHCRDCYNVIYNSSPLFLLDEGKVLDEIRPAGLRLQFSVEDAQATKGILEQYRNVFVEKRDTVVTPEQFTRGHFRRGIT